MESFSRVCSTRTKIVTTTQLRYWFNKKNENKNIWDDFIWSLLRDLWRVISRRTDDLRLRIPLRRMHPARRNCQLVSSSMSFKNHYFWHFSRKLHGHRQYSPPQFTYCVILFDISGYQRKLNSDLEVFKISDSKKQLFQASSASSTYNFQKKGFIIFLTFQLNKPAALSPQKSHIWARRLL